MFKIIKLSTKEILPISCGTREMAQIVANLLAIEEKEIFYVQ